MSKSLPRWFASFSLFCAAACGGGPATVTTVTPATAGGGAAAGDPVAPTAAGTASPPTLAFPSGATPSPAPAPTPAPDALTWTVEATGATGLSAIWGTGPTDVWAAGGAAVLHSAGDGRWTVAYQGADGDAYATVFGAGADRFVGGSVCMGGICQGGVVVRSRDGGATWTRRTVANAALHGAAADGRAYLAAWDVYASADGFDDVDVLHASFPVVEAIDAGGGALLALGGQRTGTIARSLDGGQTWATVFEGLAGSQRGHVDHVWRSGATVFAAGEACDVPACLAALVRSDDGGANWRVADGDVMANESGVWAASPDEVWVAGTTLARSRDGGASFATMALPVGGSLRGVWGSSASDVYVIADGGVVLHGRR